MSNLPYTRFFASDLENDESSSTRNSTSPSNSFFGLNRNEIADSTNNSNRNNTNNNPLLTSHLNSASIRHRIRSYSNKVRTRSYSNISNSSSGSSPSSSNGWNLCSKPLKMDAFENGNEQKHEPTNEENHIYPHNHVDKRMCNHMDMHNHTYKHNHDHAHDNVHLDAHTIPMPHIENLNINQSTLISSNTTENRNDTSLLTCLPPEILELIFSYLSFPDPGLLALASLNRHLYTYAIASIYSNDIVLNEYPISNYKVSDLRPRPDRFPVPISPIQPSSYDWSIRFSSINSQIASASSSSFISPYTVDPHNNRIKEKGKEREIKQDNDTFKNTLTRKFWKQEKDVYNTSCHDTIRFLIKNEFILTKVKYITITSIYPEATTKIIKQLTQDPQNTFSGKSFDEILNSNTPSSFPILVSTMFKNEFCNVKFLYLRTNNPVAIRILANLPQSLTKLSVMFTFPGTNSSLLSNFLQDAFYPQEVPKPSKYVGYPRLRPLPNLKSISFGCDPWIQNRHHSIGCVVSLLLDACKNNLNELIFTGLDPAVVFTYRPNWFPSFTEIFSRILTRTTSSTYNTDFHNTTSANNMFNGNPLFSDEDREEASFNARIEDSGSEDENSNDGLSEYPIAGLMYFPLLTFFLFDRAGMSNLINWCPQFVRVQLYKSRLDQASSDLSSSTSNSSSSSTAPMETSSEDYFDPTNQDLLSFRSSSRLLEGTEQEIRISNLTANDINSPRSSRNSDSSLMSPQFILPRVNNNNNNNNNNNLVRSGPNFSLLEKPSLVLVLYRGSRAECLYFDVDRFGRTLENDSLDFIEPGNMRWRVEKHGLRTVQRLRRQRNLVVDGF